jgi:hypothetical protein
MNPSISVAIAGLLYFSGAALIGSAVLPTFASDWKPVGAIPSSAFIDMASIRKDYFPTERTGSFTMQPYIVVWLKFVTNDGDVLGETLFDCQGGVEVIQQIVVNDTPNSKHHSFDNTQAIRRLGRGARVRSIPPDTYYDAVQRIICK